MGELEPIVYIVEDDAAIRESLHALMESVKLHARTCATGAEFFDVFERGRSGCVILDVRLPDMSGVKLFKRFRSECIGTPTIFVTGYGEVSVAVEAMKHGAFDFLLKPFIAQDLLDRVQMAISQDRKRLKQHVEQREALERVQSLSGLEREVLAHLLQGKTSKKIALDLGIGVKTVDFHRSNILHKMDVETVVDMIFLVIKSGYRPEEMQTIWRPGS